MRVLSPSLWRRSARLPRAARRPIRTDDKSKRNATRNGSQGLMIWATPGSVKPAARPKTRQIRA